MSRDDTRRGRSFGARLVGFLHRSRSRSKKRRSQSLEPAPVGEMPVLVPAPASLGRRNVFRGLAAAHNAAEASSPASAAKPSTRSPSRPLSGSTTAADTTARPYPYQLRRSPPAVPPKNQPAPPEAHHVHLRTEVLTADPESPPQNARKANFFSVAISHPRRPSAESGKSRPPSRTQTATPPTPPEPQRAHRGGIWASFRSGSHSGSQSSVGANSSRSNVGGEARSTPPPVPKLRPEAPRIPLSPQDDNVQILNSPPPPYRRDEFIVEVDEGVPDALDLDGRCSPLCGLPSPRLAPAAGPSLKGKERERARGARDRPREALEAKEKEPKRLERATSRARGVGSPFQRETEREGRARMTPLPVPVEKIASGSGSGLSRRSSAKESIMRSKRTKHGSFDFERPVSTNAGAAANMRNALHGMGVGPDTYGLSHAPQLEKSHSAKDPARRDAPSRAAQAAAKQTSSLPSSTGRTATRPRLDVYAPPMRRGPTGSSRETGSPAPAPGGLNTPNSSQSGHSSSLGRTAGGRAARTLHGAFRFEPAVPPIPGSPAGDPRERDKRLAAQFTPSPTPAPTATPAHARLERATRKGRSLDLGLSLAWAPKKVSEEAVLEYNRPSSRASGSVARATPRWRNEPVSRPVQLQGTGLGAAPSRAASDVARAFREALGDAAYATFKTYVHRFDAQAIPLDGPYGLISHARRLLDNAATLDERRKQELLERLLRLVRENQ